MWNRKKNRIEELERSEYRLNRRVEMQRRNIIYLKNIVQSERSKYKILSNSMDAIKPITQTFKNQISDLIETNRILREQIKQMKIVADELLGTAEESEGEDVQS